MKQRKIKLWLTCVIVYCLILIGFVPAATRVKGGEMAESGSITIPAARINSGVPDIVAPVIEHTAVTTSGAYADIVIEANVTDDQSFPHATLYYKKEGDKGFTSLSMIMTSESPAHFSVSIPRAEVQSNLIYYIEAGDGKNNSRTEEYQITVSPPESDFDKLPPFLITEVVPDSTDVNGADGYEFIEIYNNTNQNIPFKDYKIQYRYGKDPESDEIWGSVPNDFVFPAKGTVVFWIMNGKNKAKTVADFNANYQTNLVENKDIVKIHSAGMANGSLRGIVIATNTDRESAVVYYNEEACVDDVNPNKGIIYKYPVGGTNRMKKISGGQVDATPGTVSPSQVPEKAVQVPEDVMAPTVEDLTGKTEIKQIEDLLITAAAKDDGIVKTVTLYYKNNEQTAFKKVLLQQDDQDLLYHFTVYLPDLIAKKSIEYYYVVSDGTNEVKSERYKVNRTSDQSHDRLRLNVKQEEVLSGEKLIKASSDDAGPEAVKLSIDEKEVVDSTFHSLENESYLAFEVSGVNTFFQNGITMGAEILRIFDDGIPQWQTITVPIGADRLKEGANVLTIRSGDKATLFSTNHGENRDDYSLRNVRLVLADGTIIRDPLYSDSEKVIAMSDDHKAVDFTLTLPADKVLSKTYKWDTTKMADGEYTIYTTDAVNREASAQVKVDNTAPVIETNIEKNKEYKGTFTIGASAKDALAGMDTTEIKLDNEVITVPYQTSSALLSPGSHTLSIAAVDKIGNKAELSVPFSVVNEVPAKPEVISPQAGVDVQKEAAILKVNVTDPTKDDLKVSFYKGFQYSATDVDNVQIFQNATDLEPPNTMIPAGETALVNDEISKVASSDHDYLVTDSETQFPYHRFAVKIDSTVDETDVVELSWKGHSLAGRKVSMYAWSHTKDKWIMLDFKIAGAEDFILKKNVAVGEFVKDSLVNVIVQDEIPVSKADYDYTFVWMSDTQYYSENYPYIFERMTKWIVEKQEALKIKYVFHTGDLVNESDLDYQWKNASQFMKTLDDAGVPNGVLAGNHDVNHKTSDYTQFYRFFDEDRYSDRPYYGRSYKNNRGHYDLISANGNDYIMVYMGWGVDEESIAWMNAVLAQYRDRKAILSFHEYLLSTGTRHPMGDSLFNRVVVPNKNVFAVLSGHYHEAQTLVETIDDDGDGNPDRKVYQMLADYQEGLEGGQGYMRLLHFDQDHNRIIVNTYSPYLNDYNYYDADKYGNKDEFTMNVNLDSQQKRIATDSFTVNVYTDSLIGVVEDVKSGSDAETMWNGLAANQAYSWYAVAEDDFTGRTLSDIWSFTVQGTSQYY